MSNTTSYLNLDPQRRISLGKLIPKSVTGFLVEVDSQGVVTLRPATPIADVELSSAVLAEIRKGEVDVLAGGGLRYRPEDGHLLEALVRDAAQDDHA